MIFNTGQAKIVTEEKQYSGKVLKRAAEIFAICESLPRLPLALANPNHLEVEIWNKQFVTCAWIEDYDCAYDAYSKLMVLKEKGLLKTNHRHDQYFIKY